MNPLDRSTQIVRGIVLVAGTVLFGACTAPPPLTPVEKCNLLANEADRMRPVIERYASDKLPTKDELYGACLVESLKRGGA